MKERVTHENGINVSLKVHPMQQQQQQQQQLQQQATVTIAMIWLTVGDSCNV